MTIRLIMRTENEDPGRIQCLLWHFTSVYSKKYSRFIEPGMNLKNIPRLFAETPFERSPHDREQ